MLYGDAVNLSWTKTRRPWEFRCVVSTRWSYHTHTHTQRKSVEALREMFQGYLISLFGAQPACISPLWLFSLGLLEDWGLQTPTGSHQRIKGCYAKVSEMLPEMTIQDGKF